MLRFPLTLQNNNVPNQGFVFFPPVSMSEHAFKKDLVRFVLNSRYKQNSGYYLKLYYHTVLIQQFKVTKSIKKLLKGIVYTKMEILSIITHPHVIPNIDLCYHISNLIQNYDFFDEFRELH